MYAVKQKLLKIATSIVPERIKKNIVRTNKNALYPAEFGGFQQSFSQQGEDLALARYFVGRRNGFYIDVGAFHPIKYSNTYLFWLKGWRGINIEPNPDALFEFTNRRPDDINLNLAVGTAVEPLNYFRFNRETINTFNADHKDKWLTMPNTELKDVLSIQQTSLSKILDTYLPQGQKISFLDVDAEGNDLDVLMSNNWNCYRPEIVLAEHDFDLNVGLIQSPITNYMMEQGYFLKEICCGTAIFADNTTDRHSL